jgi:hypothetical protein
MFVYMKPKPSKVKGERGKKVNKTSAEQELFPVTHTVIRLLNLPCILNPGSASPSGAQTRALKRINPKGICQLPLLGPAKKRMR